MNDTSNNVISLDTRRRRPFVQVPIRIAHGTGSKPFLCKASDGEQYWCKRPSSDHEVEAVVNEVVASIIGEHINAPIRPWKILDIPPDLVGTPVGEGENRYRLRDEPVFGSKLLHTSDVIRKATAIDQDGNYDRFPKLVALWLLCNAEDIQMLYDYAGEMQVWSVDHGFWFGSHETPWGLGDPTKPWGRPELPDIRTYIAPVHWQRAIDAIDNLTRDIISEVEAAIPLEWGVDPKAYHTLVDYACSRKHYAVETLKIFQQRSDRR